jgi:long-chain acyl-CoA synthetase
VDGKLFKGTKRIFEAKRFYNFKEMVLNTQKEFGERPAFKFKTEEKGVLREMLYKDYIEEIIALSTALNSIGLENKRIGIIGDNRYAWEEAYMAIVSGTGVVVPLDKGHPEGEILSLIERSEIEAG